MRNVGGLGGRHSCDLCELGRACPPRAAGHPGSAGSGLANLRRRLADHARHCRLCICVAACGAWPRAMGRSISAVHQPGSPRDIACVDDARDIALASRSRLGSWRRLQRIAERIYSGRHGRQSWKRGALWHALWRRDVDSDPRIDGGAAVRIPYGGGYRMAHRLPCRRNCRPGDGLRGIPACLRIQAGRRTASVSIQPARAFVSGGEELAVLGAGCDLLHLWRVDVRLDRRPDRYPLHERGSQPFVERRRDGHRPARRRHRKCGERVSRGPLSRTNAAGRLLCRPRVRAALAAVHRPQPCRAGAIRRALWPRCGADVSRAREVDVRKSRQSRHRHGDGLDDGSARGGSHYRFRWRRGLRPRSLCGRLCMRWPRLPRGGRARDAAEQASGKERLSS